jgi:hypothetical protein
VCSQGHYTKRKNLIAEVNQKSLEEVMGYWHELYSPPEYARRYRLRKNHCARLIARSVARVERRLKSRPSRLEQTNQVIKKGDFDATTY